MPFFALFEKEMVLMTKILMILLMNPTMLCYALFSQQLGLTTKSIHIKSL